MIRENKAITITALTIIVIVLFIVAGVAIGASINTGLIDIAEKSTKEYDSAAIKQILDSIYLSEKNKYNSGLIDESNMWKNIERNITNNTKVNFEVENLDNKLNVKVNNKPIYEITIDGVKEIE